MVEDDKGAEHASASASASASHGDPPAIAPPHSPSLYPSGGPRTNYRIVFAVVWIVAQLALVVTAGRRSDGAFGFRMFSESSSIKLTLYREVDGPDGQRARIHVDAGVWSAPARDGTNRRHTWYDRVPTPFWVFDQEMHASYGAATQLSRLQGALDDVASHLAVKDDLVTRRFVLDVMVRRNGREPVLHQLTSRERPLPEPAGLPTTRDGGL